MMMVHVVMKVGLYIALHTPYVVHKTEKYKDVNFSVCVMCDCVRDVCVVWNINKYVSFLKYL